MKKIDCELTENEVGMLREIFEYYKEHLAFYSFSGIADFSALVSKLGVIDYEENN